MRHVGVLILGMALLGVGTSLGHTAAKLDDRVGEAGHIAAPHDGTELIGTRAPDWDVMDWLNSPPLSLEQLRGRVILVRWWTGPECPYCSASAPALNAFQAAYHARGFTVIGFYHHKALTPLTRQHVEQLIQQYQFTFPVAIDAQWRTLKQWWLTQHPKGWTSISVLLDQGGVIRAVHAGGVYTEEEVARLKALIESLLGPPPHS